MALVLKYLMIKLMVKMLNKAQAEVFESNSSMTFDNEMLIPQLSNTTERQIDEYLSPSDQ